MDDKNLILFLRALNVGGIERSTDNEWLRCSCPLAHVTHSGGTDSQPSFNVKINPAGVSGYHCFTCGSGSLSDLIHRLTWLSHYPSKAVSVLTQKEVYKDLSDSYVFDDPYAYAEAIETPVKPVPIPPEILRRYPLIQNNFTYRPAARSALDYLVGRGISANMVFTYGLRYSKTYPTSVMFPITDYDENGEIQIYHMQRRPILWKGFWFISPKTEKWEGEAWGKKDYWFGMAQADLSKPICTVESPTDVLSLRTFGMRNVIGSCGQVSDAKLNRIHTNTVYCGYDCDNTGLRYTHRTVRKMNTCSLMFRLVWQDVGIKDGGDLRNVNQLAYVWQHKRRITYKGGNFYEEPDTQVKQIFKDPYQ